MRWSREREGYLEPSTTSANLSAIMVLRSLPRSPLGYKGMIYMRLFVLTANPCDMVCGGLDLLL